MEETTLRDNPYLAPQAVVADAAVPALQLAGRGERLLAVLLDSAFVVLALLPLTLVMVLGEFPTSGPGAYLRIGLGLLPFVAFVAWNAVLLHRRGQTLGKQLLHIRVVRLDGSRCGLARIFFARYLPVTVLGFIPFLGLVISLADALLIFRDSCRCLHDEIADTIVVTA